MSEKRTHLLFRLTERLERNGEGQPCVDSVEDILREEMPGMPDHVYPQLAREFDPTEITSGRADRAAAMDSLLREEMAEVVKIILFRIWEAHKPRLMVGSLLLASGIKPLGVQSERDLARQQNVTPEHVSNMVEEWQEVLHLPRTNFQKSEQAVEAARLHNRNRRTKEDAA